MNKDKLSNWHEMVTTTSHHFNKFLTNTYKKSRTKSQTKIPHQVWTNPIHFIACGFGVGLIPFAPGTFGTLMAIPFYLMLVKLPLWGYILVTLLFNIAGIWLCGITNRDFGTDDHPAAVWDEIAAFLIVMIAVPFSWIYIALGFILFRLFDILKPWPINWIDDHVHGGLGVMLDDVLAAVYAWIILQIIVLLIHH